MVSDNNNNNYDNRSNLEKIDELLRLLNNNNNNNSNSQSRRRGGRTFSRPLTAGLRTPTTLHSIVNRQNLDPRDVFTPRVKRVTSMRDKIIEASLYRTASTLTETELFNGEGRSIKVIAFKDPYDHLSKLRFENCYRTDPVVRRCIDVLAKFTMGKRTHFNITSGTDSAEENLMVAHGFRPPPPTNSPLPSGPMPGANPSSSQQAKPPVNNSPVRTAADFSSNNIFAQDSAIPPDPDELEEEVNRMFEEREGPPSPLSEQELRILYRMITDVNHRVKFDAQVKAALVQAYVYGRSALLMETDQQGIPTELKLLNPKKLETVYVDPLTWKLVAVDYADRKENEPLLAEEIIYFANQDYHISPDTLYYGYSRIEPVMHVSETNQLLDEIDLKEGARSMWAGAGVIKFPPDTDDNLVEEFIAGFHPGTWNATSQSVQIDTYNLKLDYIALTNARMENDRRIIRGLGIPQFLVGFENISNRATSEEVMISWHESELDAERTWLQDVLEPQWFQYLVNLRFPGLMQHKNDGAFLMSGNYAPVRVKLDFQNISFETIREKSEAIVPLFDRGLATPEKALEVLRWQDQLPAVLAELQRREIEKERAFQLEFELKKQRAESYKLNRIQEGVEQRRRDEKTVSEAAAASSLTANAALQHIASLHDQQQNSSSTMNELHALQMKLLRESHAKDMELRAADLQLAAHKKKVYEQVEETLKRLKEEAN